MYLGLLHALECATSQVIVGLTYKWMDSFIDI